MKTKSETGVFKKKERVLASKTSVMGFSRPNWKNVCSESQTEGVRMDTRVQEAVWA